VQIALHYKASRMYLSISQQGTLHLQTGQLSHCICSCLAVTSTIDIVSSKTHRLKEIGKRKWENKLLTEKMGVEWWVRGTSQIALKETQAHKAVYVTWRAMDETDKRGERWWLWHRQKPLLWETQPSDGYKPADYDLEILCGSTGENRSLLAFRGLLCV
jgi:hypothetical protein